MDIFYKKKKLKVGDEYFVDKYNESGIFLVNDMFLYVDKILMVVNFLSSKDNSLFKEYNSKLKDNDVKDSVSEDFALKMLSIATKNDKYKEI